MSEHKPLLIQIGCEVEPGAPTRCEGTGKSSREGLLP
jgi:hypothetical protein